MPAIRLKDITIYEDEHIIAINKPPFIASLHERFDSLAPSVIEMCRSVNEDYSLCHRLDRETSGVMLIAKDNETYRHLAIQFEKRLVKKTYHAIVQAAVNLENLEVNLPLYTDSKRKVQISSKKGKPSSTIFNTIETFKHFSLLACEPLTGRLHQIRVHAASQNLPLVCDELYGGKVPDMGLIKRKVKYNEGEAGKPLMNRVALHAFSIQFHDAEGKEVYIEAPYPKDFEVFLKLLHKYDQKD